MFFFKRRKRTKKSLGHLRLCPRPRNALKVEKVCGSGSIGKLPRGISPLS